MYIRIISKDLKLTNESKTLEIYGKGGSMEQNKKSNKKYDFEMLEDGGIKIIGTDFELIIPPRKDNN